MEKEEIKTIGFIDGDFDSQKGSCKYHCYPSCHPCQVGPEPVYGCRNKVWPHNRYGDFVPIVDCGGDLEKCDLKNPKFKHFFRRYKQGKTNSLNYTEKKVAKLKAELDELKQYN